MKSDIDLQLEGEAIASILGVMQQLPPISRDRVLETIINLAAPMTPEPDQTNGFVHPGFEHPESGDIVANLKALSEMEYDEEEAP